jgi:hypothetical protein
VRHYFDEDRNRFLRMMVRTYIILLRVGGIDEISGTNKSYRQTTLDISVSNNYSRFGGRGSFARAACRAFEGSIKSGGENWRSACGNCGKSSREPLCDATANAGFQKQRRKYR